MYIFIAITYFKNLSQQDLNHFLTIESMIDGLLFRTPMSNLDLKQFLEKLIKAGFPKSKIIVHSNVQILKDLDLKWIHFKESDTQAFTLKQLYPDLTVGMSTHHVTTVKQCRDYHIDYVFFGHIFPTASHINETPRSYEEICNVLDIDISVLAIGGISLSTVSRLPRGFDGLCAISLFMESTVDQINTLKRKWHSHA